ncbi:hypothetical protein H0Z60_08300, partial [Ectothiorhodospiraceae bacterium WFHF3C12]|nr:hypothetical protein [Ectothiorhodospiraceae bacterium WFHF3C12]
MVTLGMDRLIFSTRGLVILLGLFLGLAPGLFPWLSRADAWSYRQAAALNPSVPDDRVILAELPAPPGADPQWLEAASGRVEALADAAALAVVIPSHWLPALNWTPEGRALQRQLRERGAVLGVAASRAPSWGGPYAALPTQPTALDAYVQAVPGSWLLHPAARLGQPRVVNLVVEAFPSAAAEGAYPLIWMDSGGEVRGDLAAVLAGRGQLGDPVAWLYGQGVSLGETFVATGVNGAVFVPPHGGQAVAV